MRERMWKHSERWSMLSNPHSDIQHQIKKIRGMSRWHTPAQAGVRSPCVSSLSSLNSTEALQAIGKWSDMEMGNTVLLRVTGSF